MGLREDLGECRASREATPQGVAPRGNPGSLVWTRAHPTGDMGCYEAPPGTPHQVWPVVAADDHDSRKVMGWAMGARATMELATVAWEAALLAEGLSADQRPFSLSDRGPPRRSPSMREFVQDRGVARLLARPRTPTDHPDIESLFLIVKTPRLSRGSPLSR